jgi:hypothetical protein
MKRIHRWKLSGANLWPPFRGMGIRVGMSDDLMSATSTLKLRFWNRNIVGTQFGGSLYAMTDPLFMMILMVNLGKDYVVWDKAATIRFKKPGRTDVKAVATITPEQLDEARRMADAHDKFEPTYTVHIIDTNGEVIAEVDKLLYVKRKDKISSRKTAA